jgi:V/A-type H+-transporting ATPase subunit E
MNGIEKITEKILDDAKKDALRIIKDAEEQAKKIIEKNEEKAQKEKEIIAKTVLQKDKELHKNVIDMAELEGRKKILSTKQKVLDIVFREAFDKLNSLSEEEKVSFLAKMAFEASVTGKEIVILSKQDKELVGEKVVKLSNELLNKAGKKAELVLSNEVRQIEGGLVLKDGDIETNCTYEVIFKDKRNDLATDVAMKVFS